MNTPDGNNGEKPKRPKSKPAKYLTVRVRVRDDLSDALETISKATEKAYGVEEDRARWLQILLLEAIYAVADQVEINDYVAWQPRFNVDTRPGRRLEDGKLERDCPSRHLERCARSYANECRIEIVLREAAKLAEKLPD